MSSQTNTQNQEQIQQQQIPANVPPPYINPPTPAPEMSPEQKQLMNIINELVLGAQELGFELATLPYHLIEAHPELKDWYEVSRKQVMAVKKLVKFLRERKTG